MKATFHQLEVFECVARRLSFTRAAEEMGLSQSTVSTQIKQLSEEVGLPLFEQIGKTLYLTQAGQELLATAAELRLQWTLFESNIAGLKGMTRGSLKLACVTTAKYFAPEILGSFCEKFPEIEVKLEIANREKLIERLRKNLDDLLIMTLPPEDIEIETLPFLDNPLVVVASNRHPKVLQKNISIADLAMERFILREHGSGTRETSEAFFSRHNFTPKVRMELGSNEAIKHSVAGGLGISVLSQHVLDVDPAYDRLAVLDVAGFPLFEKWHVLYPKGKRLSLVARAFLDYLVASPHPKIPRSLDFPENS
jgi:LysR family transcriptional regulator, low CO2-responsive transcriptional regulator